ncbi:unnamed protein product [Linum trigynum]|uniref:Uncharacterized protein n=1 Tax=Linum trigynum TaxID=586398 RepID=A0AAV2FYB5_9ROSI
MSPVRRRSGTNRNSSPERNDGGDGPENPSLFARGRDGKDGRYHGAGERPRRQRECTAADKEYNGKRFSNAAADRKPLAVRVVESHPRLDGGRVAAVTLDAVNRTDGGSEPLIEDGANVLSEAAEKNLLLSAKGKRVLGECVEKERNKEAWGKALISGPVMILWSLPKTPFNNMAPQIEFL